jgi:serine/threonine protein kinase
MGEVYRATDTKLGREVALKLLPPELADDTERLARFRREARTLASLHHARIASLFGIEEIDGAMILVMELVEGRDFSEHLAASGSMAIEDVVSAAIQIAEGLEFAHDNSVMHRDLKPANIKITDQGEVKLLDFGLARAFTGEPTDESVLANSPTITAALTHAGVILGTAAYMSPEQAKGRSVDRRADIWSYGVVIYELLVGRKLFDGETASETMAEVLKTEIDWEQLPSDTPLALRRLLSRCLDRDPATRLRDIGEARVSLENLKAGRSDESETTSDTPTSSSFRGERIMWAALLLASLVGLAGLALLRPEQSKTPLIQTDLAAPTDWDFAPASPYSVSPDGSRIAYVAVPRRDSEDRATGTNAIWIRDLASPEPRLLARADRDAYPFWSPDGQWIGFFANGKLNKVESRGGPVIELCDAMEGRGGSWSQDGIIIFQRDWSESLMKIAAGGGSPEPLTSLNAERQELLHRWPAFLPDGRHFIFYVACTTNPGEHESSGIYLGSLDSSETRMLLRGESRALYSKGHLLYRIGSTLMAHPFDLSTNMLAGDPRPVATDIPGGAISWGGAQFGVSESGLLIHMRGAGVMSTVFNWRIRDENTTIATAIEAGSYYEPKLSHDGTRLAVVAGQDAGDVWIKNIESAMQTRFSFDSADDRTPLWSPDDLRIAFSSSRSSAGEIYVRPVSGEEPAKLIYASDARISLSDWSSDGRYIFFDRVDPGTGDSDIWSLDMESLEAAAVLEGSAWQQHASLSPDGKYLAFSEGGSADAQIYVQSYPVASGRWMVSGDNTAGLPTLARWQEDGRALFYLRGSALMMVPTETTSTFSASTPQFQFNLRFISGSPSYDLAPGNQRVLMQEMEASNRDRAGAGLIQNWPALLEQ